ncbi:MAG: pyridoxal-dependent decarboxylase [Cytophagales bacterium]|nr:pyridoxal-dependent decarboxylase [Cytophagales bacterium]
MKYWKKLSENELRERVADALDRNVDYRNKTILGVPASHLDEKVFYGNASFLKDAPFLSTMIHNPNHIGCHTLGESESFFAGTQKIEKELIALVAEDILKGETDGQDGYVASGGTEANIQAIWIYRNYFVKAHGATMDEICIIGSEDCHYSLDKAANLLNLQFYKSKVNHLDRTVSPANFERTVDDAISNGIKYVIGVANMMTTMFGSVDDIEMMTDLLSGKNLEYKIHVDGAYGGFVYPFSCKQSKLDFSNPNVGSITLDAHKMVQAPFGTGIFLAKKGFMRYVYTEEAQYVQGLDATLIGSRSGANAIAVWMILMSYGPHGWFEKIHILQYRTDWLCNRLKEKGISYFRQPYSNQVAIESRFLTKEIVEKYGLVPDTHTNTPSWYKIVVMEHVTVDVLAPFIEEILTRV